MFSRRLVTLRMLWQKTAGWSQERLIITDSCHHSPSVIICGCLSSKCLNLYRAEVSLSRKQDVIAVYAFCILNIILSNAFDFYWGQNPLIWGPKQVFCIKVEWLAFTWGSQPIEATPNVAKFEGRWPKSVHNAGSNLGNGGTKWGIMSGKVPHQSDQGAR